MKIEWQDSEEDNPIIYTWGKGRRGEYYMGKVSIGFCVSMDMPTGGIAFIGNGSTLDEAKAVAERFDRSDDKLTA